METGYIGFVPVAAQRGFESLVFAPYLVLPVRLRFALGLRLLVPDSLTADGSSLAVKLGH